MENQVKSLAQRLIDECISSQSTFLDLGNCGLTDESEELISINELDFLKEINLGTYYYIDNTQVNSDNNENFNILKTLPKLLPKTIEAIFINQTMLQNIDGLDKYNYLKIFDAYGNNVTSFNLMSKMPLLVSFGLSNNEVKTLENINFSEIMPSIKYLYLGGNKIESIHEEKFKDTIYLEKLYLYKNRIENINFLKNNNSIKQIYLKNNLIKELDALKEVTNLELANFNDNPIENNDKLLSIINNSQNPVEIRSVLKECSIVEILIDDCKRTNSTFLDLGNCGLYDGSKELEKLKDLDAVESLTLGKGYYDSNGVYKNSKNQYTNNTFTLIPSKLPPNLIELQIRNSEILKINLLNTPKLELLDLSFNKIMRIENLQVLISLKELALHGNNITKIENLSHLKNLKKLHLSSNKIKRIEGLEKLNLDELQLYSNEIEYIRPLIKLKSVEKFSITNNPLIRDCPSDIWLNNNLNEIKTYFNNLSINSNKSPEDAYNDVKLIILGNSDTGKTHLVHFLEKGEFLDKRNSTHGLNIIRWKPDEQRFPKLKNIRVSIWDFGGQEYYHEAYKLFLDNEALFIIFWTSETDKNDKIDTIIEQNKEAVKIEHFEKNYWLDTINHYRENINTKLILVQNKVDTINLKSRVPQILHDKYNILESFHISLKKGANKENEKEYRNLTEFCTYISDTLFEMANNTASHTHEYIEIRKEIINLQNDRPSIFSDNVQEDLYIFLNDFKTISQNQKGINVEHYAKWLNTGGNVVYFENNDELKDKLFYNPKIISNKIYEILNNNVLKNNGILDIDKSEENLSVIINLMMAMNLIYKIDDSKYLAPQYLPNDHPIEDFYKMVNRENWNESFWIRVPVFYYKRLFQFILIKFIKDSELEAKYFWKNGLLVFINKKMVLIKGLFNKDNQTVIQISVEEGNDKYKLKRELFNIIKQFNDTLKPLSSQNQISYFFDNLEVGITDKDFFKYAEIEKLTLNEENNRLLLGIVSNETEFILPKNVFVSYSHHNTNVLLKLKKHMIGLNKSALIKEWTDKELLPGDKWDNKIKEQIDKADIFIILLSADFFASVYIWDVELKAIFEKVQKKGATLIPIYIESFDLDSIPKINENGKINDFQILPHDENGRLKPINQWQNEADAYKTIVEQLRVALNKSLSLK